jgi:hypothetical protein
MVAVEVTRSEVTRCEPAPAMIEVELVARFHSKGVIPGIDIAYRAMRRH